MDIAIAVDNVSKQFRRYHVNKPTTFHQAFLQGMNWMKPVDQFWALKDVSFSIAPGRMVGVIGRNGSGKSTLLSLISGISQPDRGRIRALGRMRALLDLGVGLHPDLTGRENVFVNGVISGLTHREVQRQFDAIVAFAELEAFIDNPLRTYSAGMRMRLGFSIAVHTSPEILLIDEVLAVGDLAFQRKCIERIAQFKAEGCTILFVSHDESQIKKLCDEVIYLRQGQLIAQGQPEMVVGQYLVDMREETHRRTPTQTVTALTSTGIELKPNQNRFGSLEMQITSVRLLNAAGREIQELHTGDTLQVEIEYIAPHPIASPIFGVRITREDDLSCYDSSTAEAGQTLPVIQGQGRLILHLDRLDLTGGEYFVDVSIYESKWEYAYDYHWHVYPLLMRSTGFGNGILHAPNRWELQNSLPLVSQRSS